MVPPAKPGPAAPIALLGLLVALLLVSAVPVAAPGARAGTPSPSIDAGVARHALGPLRPAVTPVPPATSVLPSRASVPVERTFPHSRPSSGAADATVSLINNTVAYGNERVRVANGVNGLAVDTAIGTVFAIGSSSDGLVELNITTGRLVTQIPTNATAVPGTSLTLGTPGAIAFNSADNQLFVSDPGQDLVLIYNVSATGAMQGYAAIVDPSSPAYTPFALLAVPSLNLVFIANRGNDSVTIINGVNDQVLVGFTNVGARPNALAYDPSDNLVFVADSIAPVEAITMTPSGAVAPNGIALPAAPVALAYDPTSATIWAGGTTAITEIVAASQKAIANATVPSGALHDLQWDPDTLSMVASNFYSGSVTYLAAAAPNFSNITRNISIGGDPLNLVVDPLLYEVGVAEGFSNEVVTVSDSTASVDHRWPVGLAPGLGTFDPVNDYLAIPDSSSDYVLEIADTAVIPGDHPLQRELSVPGHPVAVAFDPLAGTIVAGLFDGDVVALNASSGALVQSVNVTTPGVIADLIYGDGELLLTGGPSAVWLLDARNLTATGIVLFASGSEPRRLAYDPTDQLLFVSLFAANAFGVVDLQNDRVLAVYGGGYAPLGIGYSPLGGEVFLADTGSDQIEARLASNGSLVNTVSVDQGGIPNGVGPTELMFLPGADQVLVTVPDADILDEFDASTLTLTTQFAVGDRPESIMFANRTANLYVANLDDGTLSVIATGLSTVVPFSVRLVASTNDTDAGSSVTFTVETSYPAWDFSYVWLQTLPGCTGGNSSLLSCHPSTPAPIGGTQVRVRSLAGDVQTTAVLNVTIVADPNSVLLQISRSTVTVGQPVTFTTLVSGGVLPYQYAYTDLPPGCPVATTATFTCAPTGSGTPTPAVTVTDAIGFSASSATVPLRINDLPVTVPQLSSASVSIGQKVTIEADATQGTAPYTYSYTGLPIGCTSANTSALTCSPTQSGSYGITVKVVDASGASVTSAPIYLTVNAPPTSPGGSGASGALLYIGLGVVALAVIVTVVALLARRRPSGDSAPPTPPEPTELVGAGEFSTASALPAEEAAPEEMDADSTVAAPRYFSGPGSEAPSAGAPPSPGRGSAAKLVCPSCGAENDPWLVNCRSCRRPLSVT